MASVTQTPDAVQLKVELKAWERAFATANQGRKATRTDIKNDPEIAAKYKLYDEICRPRKQNATPKKSRHVMHTDRPDPRNIHATPQAKRKSNALDFMSPTKPMSPTPQAIRQRLGPTPQKDGQILGLFEDLVATTPSRSRQVLTEVNGNVAATPSKGGQYDDDLEEMESKRFGRTPTSAGKRYMLDTFATPMKRKRDDVAQTPSVTRYVERTPQFLRRTSKLFTTGLDTVDEATELDGVRTIQPPFKKRGFVRSLSSIIKGLKHQETEKADEDWDLLHEMEAETEDQPVLAEKSAKTTNATSHEPTIVEETQMDMPGGDDVDMPLGPDMLAYSDEDSGADDPGAVDANGQPRKVWKKKGLKRQTRKVKMRPPTRIATTLAPDEPVTLQEMLREAQADGEDDFSGSDFDESDLQPSKVASKPITTEDGKPSKLRKIKATANANFCRLKIKNKNSKAKGRGRFGRR